MSLLYKDRIENLLDININCNFEESIFKSIFETLIWMDYFKCYNKLEGFFSNSIKLGNKRHLYLPYYLYYIHKNCVRVFYIFCDDRFEDCLYDGLISVIISEGCISDLTNNMGVMTEEILEYNELYQYYLWNKELLEYPLDHWKHKIYPKALCNKAYVLVNSYIKELNIHEKHTYNMNELCLIIANIHCNIEHTNNKMKQQRFYCYYHDDDSYFCINLQNPEILEKEFKDNDERIWSFSIMNLDYPSEIFNKN